MLDRFVERAVVFLKDPGSGGICVKVMLHLDEQTPHIQAHKLPAASVACLLRD